MAYMLPVAVSARVESNFSNHAPALCIVCMEGSAPTSNAREPAGVHPLSSMKGNLWLKPLTASTAV